MNPQRPRRRKDVTEKEHAEPYKNIFEKAYLLNGVVQFDDDTGEFISGDG